MPYTWGQKKTPIVPSKQTTTPFVTSPSFYSFDYVMSYSTPKICQREVSFVATTILLWMDRSINQPPRKKEWKERKRTEGEFHRSLTPRTLFVTLIIVTQSINHQSSKSINRPHSFFLKCKFKMLRGRPLIPAPPLWHHDQPQTKIPDPARSEAQQQQDWWRSDIIIIHSLLSTYILSRARLSPYDISQSKAKTQSKAIVNHQSTLRIY